VRDKVKGYLNLVYDSADEYMESVSYCGGVNEGVIFRGLVVGTRKPTFLTVGGLGLYMISTFCVP
jgi:hypothetical protein